MEVVLAILVGVLYTAGVYMLLRRSILKFIIGIIFMSMATNLLVFLSAGIVRGNPSFVGGKATDYFTTGRSVATGAGINRHCFGLGMVFFILALKYKFF
jgi:multicomponent Na+:H+ antiporter subunit C